MAISLYDATVTSFLQVLGGASGFLERGLAHCVDNGVDPETIVDTRLYNDMLPFRFQVYSIAHHSQGAVAGVKAGVFSPAGPAATATYADLQAMVADAQTALKAVTPDEINTLEGRDMLFQMGERKMPFTVEGFLLSFSLPNLHFHATTAYDILRSKGVPLGKRDYLGPMRLEV